MNQEQAEEMLRLLREISPRLDKTVELLERIASSPMLGGSAGYRESIYTGLGYVAPAERKRRAG